LVYYEQGQPVGYNPAAARGDGLRALITGIAGFAGSHLAEYLVANTDLQVHGLILPQFGVVNVQTIRDRLTLHDGDVADYQRVLRLLAESRPDLIFHLAAQSAPSLSLLQPGETLTNNILGQLNILQAAVQLGMAPRILVIGSADEYGLVSPAELPVTETNALRPVNPYSVSKIAQDYLGYQYFLSHHLPVVRLRPFNHIGPRQGPGFVVSDFAKQIAEAEAGKRAPEVHVGSLESQRDFTDVRDMVRAYHLALTLGEPGEVYNVGSGKAHAVGEILDRLLAMSTAKISVAPDAARLRPSDIPILVCDCAKFRARTGWQPVIPLEQTLSDVLAYWRRQVALS
jgi:GDP-4-dehydro-6-deoxy-D-mannose reductase